MPEPTLQKRRDLMDGYLLSPEGATVADAIHTADISNSQNRERLVKKGNVLLTMHNSATRPAELETEPPSLERCSEALARIAERKEETIAKLEAQLLEAESELHELLTRDQRSYWRKRRDGLRRKIDEIKNEQVTAEELYRAFVREDVELRARGVSPEFRAQMAALERQRNLERELAHDGKSAVLPGNEAASR